jgi:excisionase family DNA binding protein
LSESNDRLETPKQCAARVGVTERQIRYLITSGQIEYVEIGKRILLPVTAFANFLEARKVRPWHAETKDRDSVGSTSAMVSTSAGPNPAAVASAQLARQTAQRLKSFSRNGCSSEVATTVQVIPLKSS